MLFSKARRRCGLCASSEFQHDLDIDRGGFLAARRPLNFPNNKSRVRSSRWRTACNAVCGLWWALVLAPDSRLTETALVGDRPL